MKVLILLGVFACLVQQELILARILTEVHPDARFIPRTGSLLDCAKYTHDYEILSSFPFITSLNPLSPSTSKTYGVIDMNENIYYLNIYNQRYLPNTVFCLKSLKELYVRGTSFYEFELDDDSVRELPADIERLASSLMYLGIYDTTVTHLPETIGKLTRLYRFELSNTGLVALPDSIGDLSSLQYLLVPKNKLTSLPTTIASIRSLFYVTLNDNPRLRSIQPLNGLPSLTNLHTQNCPIERLPLNLPSLHVLQMQNNNLTDLINIGTLGNGSTLTKSFYFNMNRIRFISPSIRNVRNLHRLELGQNELMTLPTEIFNITTLRYLDIRNNLFSGTELRAIVAKFNSTNSSLTLYWSNIRTLSIETQ